MIMLFNLQIWRPDVLIKKWTEAQVLHWQQHNGIRLLCGISSCLGVMDE